MKRGKFQYNRYKTSKIRVDKMNGSEMKDRRMDIDSYGISSKSICNTADIHMYKYDQAEYDTIFNFLQECDKCRKDTGVQCFSKCLRVLK